MPQDLIKPLFEKALDSAKRTLDAAGTIGPMALFVYGMDISDAGPWESITKAVSIHSKSEFQKEAVRMRIQTKV